METCVILCHVVIFIIHWMRRLLLSKIKNFVEHKNHRVSAGVV